MTGVFRFAFLTGLLVSPVRAIAQDPGVPADAPDTNAPAIPGMIRATLPPSFSEPSVALPPGVVLVRIIDETGAPVPHVSVRLGAMRNGERQAARELLTRDDGVAQFENLTAGVSVAYRVSSERDGAKFGAMPFQLATDRGQRVQIVRLPVSHDTRGILLTDSRTEVTFADDRLVVTERATFVNATGLSLDGTTPHPIVFVPTDGLRFALPPGQSAFRSDDETMGDQRVTEEDGAAVLRGSLPPSDRGEGIEVSFQFRVLLDATSIPIRLAFPAGIPVLSATVAAQAPAGMTLEVAGFPGAQSGTANGAHVLFTHRERHAREDAAIDVIDLRLSGLPATAGPERTVAGFVAAATVLLAIGFAVRSSRTTAKVGRIDVVWSGRERARIEQEVRELSRAHASGDVGPETYARQRRELVERLARLLAAQG